MPDRHDHRRAGVYRHRAQELIEAAKHELRDEGRRRHLHELAATYQRVADEMAPPPAPAAHREDAKVQ